MSRGGRAIRPIASDLFADGWLPPRAAAARLDTTPMALEARARRGEVRRKQIAPGIWLYEVPRG